VGSLATCCLQTTRHARPHYCNS